MSRKKTKSPRIIPFHAIDSCVYLERGLRGQERDSCSRYLARVGYKGRNQGVLTLPLMGEIFCGIFKSLDDSVARKLAFDFLETLLDVQLKTKKVIIKPLEKYDTSYIEQILEIDSRISFDDAIHLSTAIMGGCKYFVTIDKVFLYKITQKEVQHTFGIKMRHPCEIN